MTGVHVHVGCLAYLRILALRCVTGFPYFHLLSLREAHRGIWGLGSGCDWSSTLDQLGQEFGP